MRHGMIVQLTDAKLHESGVRFTFGMMNELGINVNLMWASQSFWQFAT